MRQMLPLRLRLPYATVEEFIEKYGSNVARGGLFIATRAPKPEGTKLAFELLLADGARLLRGEGTVVKVQAEGSTRPGMTVRFTRLDASSKALIDRVLSSRKPDSAPEPKPQEEASSAVEAPAIPAPPKRTRPVISAEALRQQATTARVPTPAAPVPVAQPTPVAPKQAPVPKAAPTTPPVASPKPAAPPAAKQAAVEPKAAPAQPKPSSSPGAKPPAEARPQPLPAVPKPPAPSVPEAPAALASALEELVDLSEEAPPVAPSPRDIPLAQPQAAPPPEPRAAPPSPPPAPAAPVQAPSIVPEAPPIPAPEPKTRRRATFLELPTAPPVTAALPEVVLGIDLGTSQARVAVYHGGTAKLVPLGEGPGGIPAIAAEDASGQLLVGAAARAVAERTPRQAAHGLQRVLGLRARSPLLRALTGPLPFPILPGPQGDASTELHGRPLSLPEFSAQLLRELKAAACTFLGHEASRAVLCVPAHFDDRQRSAMREAATLAGLTVVRILNAPSAAALAFGHGRGLARKRILVVSLGGGSLEASVVQVTGDDLELITTGGDPTLGGMDFDGRIAEALLAELQAQGHPRPEHPLDWGPLLAAAETVKVALSEREESSVSVGSLSVSLTRERLEALTADLVQRLTLTVRQVLESSALTPQGLDAVVLVGGQGRAPLVRRRLEESLGVPVQTDVEPLGSAALGAALLGQGILDTAAGKPGATISEVLSVPLGVGERGGTLRRVFERNTRLPAEKTLVIPVTPGPLTLALFQGLSPLAPENEYLGALTLNVERPGEAEVHFSLSQDGTLSLAATLPGAKRQPVTLASEMVEDADMEALLARSPLEGQPENRPGGLLSGIRKLFGRR